jgi:sporulation protein YlmC with PRC-barrel domain
MEIEMRPTNFIDLTRDMTSGYQTPGVNFLQHGEMVNERFLDLIGRQEMNWRLPKWFSSYKDQIIEKLQPDLSLISAYQIWHDCGKPYARSVDSNGKVHYPDHSKVSSEIWESLGGCPRIGNLILRDMDFHLLKPAEAKEYSNQPDCLILLVTALCEVHANAEMFGGQESDSFKIKWKRLNKVGDIIIENHL